MMIIKGLAAATLLLFFCAPSAQASEILRFSEEIPPQMKIFSPAHVNATDLNNDGKNEFILKTARSSCDEGGCTHLIKAQKNAQWITLGTIHAHKIKVSDKTHYGVRDILAYTDAHNDFAPSRYVWNPKTFAYDRKDN